MTLPTEASLQSFILTRDRARARVFYRDVLGLNEVGEDPFGVVYDLGESELRLVDLPNHAPSAHTVLGWIVPDLRATLAELGPKGIKALIYEGFGQDKDGIWTDPSGKCLLVWFADPDGNVLSLCQKD